jgi:hypothetical protein
MPVGLSLDKPPLTAPWRPGAACLSWVAVRELPSPLLTTVGLAGGFAVARATRNRPLGGAVWVTAGLLCIPSWRKAGLRRSLLAGSHLCRRSCRLSSAGQTGRRLAFGSDREREHSCPQLGPVRAWLIEGPRAARLGSQTVTAVSVATTDAVVLNEILGLPTPTFTGWQCQRGEATSSPDVRNGMCNRRDSAPGSPGARARPPRRARPVPPQ